MKLRNKKTGEIEIVSPIYLQSQGEYNSLAELNEEWEDCEESKDLKEYWYINEFGSPIQVNHTRENIYDKSRKKIGNYFTSREEAGQAVEKLKAWKRLKDNGFKFEGIEKRGHHINFYQGRSYESDKQCQQAMKDIDLLFGGEECTE